MFARQEQNKWQTSRPGTKRARAETLRILELQEKATAILWGKSPDTALGAAFHAEFILLDRYMECEIPPKVYVFGVSQEDAERVLEAVKTYPGACLEETRQIIELLSELAPDAAWLASHNVSVEFQARYGTRH